MKAVAAIVQPAPIDIDLIAEQIITALADHRGIGTRIARLEGQLEDARGAARMRRIEIGQLLTKARGAWPASGPKAKGWSEFLARVKLDDSTAVRYINEFRDPTGEDSAQSRAKPTGDRDPALSNFGGNGDPARGSYCTPRKYALAVGSWDLDPFSNPRSHIVSRESCQLERGDNGLLDLGDPGAYLIAGADHRAEPFDIESDDAIIAAASRGRRRATESTRVWLQPDYSFVDDAIAHYGHTRFCALLRWAPDTEWFAKLWPLVRVVAFPIGERLEFEPAPGIETSSSPHAHAFHYTDERDVTDEIRQLCIVLRVDH